MSQKTCFILIKQKSSNIALFYHNKIIDLDILKVPHPKLYYRNFVLVPFNEIAPNFQCPVTKKNISQLLSECSDDSKISIHTH